MTKQLSETTAQVLSFLNQHKGEFISGQELANALSITRAAIWKAIERLREEGFNVEASTNKGYRLSQDADVFDADSIRAELSNAADKFYREFRIFSSIDSTSNYLQSIGSNEREGLVVVAETQTAGRGRFKRSFYCPKGTGIYFSLLLHPNCALKESTRLTAAAAVAVAQACETINKELTTGDVKIKWVNDLYLREKKICGILTEASVSIETGKMDLAVLGVGINLTFDSKCAPKELTGAGGIFRSSPPIGARAKLLGRFLENFYLLYATLFNQDKSTSEKAAKELAQEYRSRQMLIGEKIEVVENLFNDNQTRSALAVGIDDEFRLLVCFEDEPFKVVALNGGEARVKK